MVRGFTLAEVMMTIAIAAIVLGIGVPSFQTMIQNSRKTTAINDMRAALALARSSAITHRERITVCKSSDNSNCTENGDWSQGWIVFHDPNSPGTRDDDEEIIRVHEALKSGSFTGSRLVADRISFTPQGMANGTLGTLTYSDSRGAEYNGSLVISFGGQVGYEDASSTN